MDTKFASPESLVGQELAAVCFVRDYVVLEFDGPSLQAINDPWIQLGERELRFPGPGSRDALCALIGLSVAAVEQIEAQHIRLTFPGDASVTIPLGRQHAIGVEAAIFVPGPNLPLQVFE